MKQPMWNSDAVKAYETGQGVELVDEPYPHYIPSKGEKHMTEEDEEFERISNKQKIKANKVMSTDELKAIIRNETLEEVAQQFDKLKNFGDTSQSFATFVRNMKT